MENKIIEIPAFNVDNMELLQETLFKLYELKHNKHNKIIDPDKHIDALISQYNVSVDECEEELTKRRNLWKNALMGYYKMTCIKVSNGIKYSNVYYIFPYDLLDSNDTLWCLCIDDNQYEGGVKDTCYNISDKWGYTVRLEEISKEEFIEIAHKSCDDVIDRRLSKIVTKEEETNYFKKQ